MVDIKAFQVKDLREKTGLGLMDCKKALQESDGDIDLAIEELRKTSGLKASKKSGRSAADGVIGGFTNEKQTYIVEVNCETDFVARDESFQAFVEEVLAEVINKPSASLEGLLNDGLEDKREKLVQKLGENIVVRRIARNIESSSVSALYLHNNKKIGTIVSLQGGSVEIAKDIAMHAAATDPLAISPEEIPKDVLEKEREIYVAQSSETGKPDDIIKKMVEGKMRKFLSEVSLTEQNFVKDPSKRISDILKEGDAKILGFTRFEVGEGIEIEEVDFASEVMSQIKDS